MHSAADNSGTARAPAEAGVVKSASGPVEQTAEQAGPDSGRTPDAGLGGVSTSTATRARRLARRHWPLLVVCAFAVALRAPLVAIIHSQPTSDSFFYVTAARSLAEGHGYVWNGHPTAFFPIGWPAFIAALYAVTRSFSFSVVLWAGVALWAVSTALMYILALRLGGRAAAIIAAFLVAAYPDFVFASLRALSETLFVPLLIGACILLTPARGERISIRRAAIAAVVLGLAILVRSTAVPLPLVLGLWLFFSHRDLRSLKTAAAFVAVAYLVLAPWIVRNELVMKTLAISTNGGYTLWLGDNPHATGSNVVVHTRHPRWALASTASEVRDNTVRTREALHFIRYDFGRWLQLVWPKAVFLFRWQPAYVIRAMDAGVSAPQAPRHVRVLTGAEHALIGRILSLDPILRTLHAVWWYAGAIMTVLAIIRRRPGAVLIGLLVGFWVLLHITLIHGQFRYMLSVQPLLAAPLAWSLSAAFATLWRWVRGRPAVADVKAHRGVPREAARPEGSA
jgi:4-amino-4-deoxy-L-arabinose transferase-like glycosyltransferase